MSTTEKPNTSSEPTPQQVEDPNKDNESIAIGFVADILVDILQRVQWNNRDDLHEEIFDGVLTLILEHIGQLLSVSIFGERVSDSDNPGNISFWEFSKEQSMKDCDFKLKSKYLIHIFDVALKVLNEKKMGGKTEKLVKQAYKKIRHTLITNTLGGNLEDLRIPEQVQPNPLDRPTLEDLEMYSPKWAIQCIFTMVGIADDEFEGISEAAISRAISGKSKFVNRNTGTEYRFEDGAEDVVTDAIELAIGDALGLRTDVENSLEYGYEDDVEPAEEVQSAVNLDPEERLERYRYPRSTRIL
ncbi:hypothetical protein EYC80_009118 [Monilinia laxa]|nr:hypothetical protein EYC80_009118 [Monilinia laxa]